MQWRREVGQELEQLPLSIETPLMTIDKNIWEEEMATAKAMLEKLIKGSEEKEACIKM